MQHGRIMIRDAQRSEIMGGVEVPGAILVYEHDGESPIPETATTSVMPSLDLYWNRNPGEGQRSGAAQRAAPGPARGCGSCRQGAGRLLRAAQSGADQPHDPHPPPRPRRRVRSRRVTDISLLINDTGSYSDQTATRARQVLGERFAQMRKEIAELEGRLELARVTEAATKALMAEQAREMVQGSASAALVNADVDRLRRENDRLSLDNEALREDLERSAAKPRFREVVERVLENTQVDSLVTKRHGERLADELVEALEAAPSD